MKTLLSIALIITGFATLAQVRTPSASPGGSVSTVVGLTEVKIDYSRPRIKGRKIFGEGAGFVTPYGSIWRTGANNGSKITFADDVTVEGIKVPAGSYMIYTWPGASEWTISLYKDLELGGNTSGYDKSKEAANFKVKSEKLAEKIETLTFAIGDIADDSKTAKVQLAWENTSVKFTIGVDFDAKVMESIKNTTGQSGGAFYQAATYYFENGKDNKQALDWATIATTANKDAYWAWLLKAKIQKALGDKKGAMESSVASRAAAEKDGNKDYVRMNDDLQKSIK